MINFDNGNFEAKCKIAWARVKNLRKKTKEMVCIGLTVAMLGSFVIYDAGHSIAYASGASEGTPHAIVAGGEEIAVLPSEHDAQMVIENVKTEYCGMNEEATAMITPAVTIQEKEFVTAEDVQVVTVADATSDILEQNATSDPYFEMTVTQPMVMSKIIQHDTKYVKDKTMKKGKTKVSKKGKNGEKILIGNQTLVNGVVESTEVYSQEIVSKPVTEVIKKGTKVKKKKETTTSESSSSSDYSSSSSSSSSSTGSSSGYVSYNPSTSAGIVGYAQAFHGVPYVWGGTTPAGFDCSGFTAYVYRAFGINLPHSSAAQAGYGVAVSAADARPGDLVVMPGHVGIYVGNGMMCHAPAPGQSVKTQAIYAACSFRRLV